MEQRSLLEKKPARRLFQQVKDGSSSLHVLCDPASRFSVITDNLSKLSAVFIFKTTLGDQTDPHTIPCMRGLRLLSFDSDGTIFSVR